EGRRKRGPGTSKVVRQPIFLSGTGGREGKEGASAARTPPRGSHAPRNRLDSKSSAGLYDRLSPYSVKGRDLGQCGQSGGFTSHRCGPGGRPWSRWGRRCARVFVSS